MDGHLSKRKSMWKFVFASVPGTSHEATLLPCQDYSCVELLNLPDGDMLVACCADGAGSATRSGEGASIVCNALASIVQRDITSSDEISSISRETVISWLVEAREALTEFAAFSNIEVRELASTVLVSVIGDTSALFIQLGDGAIVVDQGDAHRAVFWPQSGEYANTTNFVTSERFAEAVEVVCLSERINALAMFSDGLERLVLKFTDKSVHSPFLAPMLNAIAASAVPESLTAPLEAFLRSDNVNKRTDDDKTLILAIRN